MQVVDLDGVSATDLCVHVKWVYSAETTPELMNLLRRATPYMLDFARQLCGVEVGVCPFTTLRVSMLRISDFVHATPCVWDQSSWLHTQEIDQVHLC